MKQLTLSEMTKVSHQYVALSLMRKPWRPGGVAEEVFQQLGHDPVFGVVHQVPAGVQELLPGPDEVGAVGEDQDADGGAVNLFRGRERGVQRRRRGERVEQRPALAQGVQGQDAGVLGERVEGLQGVIPVKSVGVGHRTGTGPQCRAVKSWSRKASSGMSPAKTDRGDCPGGWVKSSNDSVQYRCRACTWPVVG